MPAKLKNASCSSCGREFSNPSKLSRHRLEVHGPSRFQCVTCKKRFSRRENYLKHLSNPNVHLTCPECARADFGNRRHLIQHIRSQHTQYRDRVQLANLKYRMNRVRMDKNSFSSEELSALPPQDPDVPTEEILNSYPLEYQALVAENWNWIRTKYKKRSISSTYSFRFSEGELSLHEVEGLLRKIHQIQTGCYKINLQFGYAYRILKTLVDPDVEEVEYSDPLYFIPQKPSVSNPSFLPELWTIAKEEHLVDLIDRLDETDILEHLNLRRPSTKYIVEMVMNVMVYVYQLDKTLIGCSEGTLPKYLREKKCVLTMYYRHSARKEPWKKPQCLFRCLAASKLLKATSSDQLYKMSRWSLLVEVASDALCERYCKGKGILMEQFDGAVSLYQLEEVESILDFKIFVYELVPKSESHPSDWRETCCSADLVASLLRKPAIDASASSSTVYLDLCDSHFSLILDMEVYSSTFICGVNNCRRLFKCRKLCQQHQERCNGPKRKVRCTGGGYEPTPTLFEELESVGVSVAFEDRFMDYFATYDCETLTVKISANQQLHGAGTRHEAELILASISVCSSVPGFQRPEFMLSEGNPKELVRRCVQYLTTMAEEAERLLKLKYRSAFDCLRELASKEQEPKHRNSLEKLLQKLEKRTEQLHVFGWNSRGFDLPLLRSYIFEVFRAEDIQVQKILKKSSAYLLLCTDRLKFLDMQALISPTASYANWLKSLGIPNAEKSHFPFSWFDSLEKLRQTHLPSRHYWNNDLKDQQLTDTQWQEIKSAWKIHGMKSMVDFLAYYNNKDVSHFVEGVQIQQKFWKQQGICMITEAVSLSGLALRLFNSHIPPDIYFSLPNKSDYKFIRTLRKSVCGGLSQTFHRFHLVGKTTIRNGPYLCQKIVGYDFNSLYLAELGQELPVGVPYEWKPSLNQSGQLAFRRRCILPDSVSLMELEYLSYESWRRQKRIRHYLTSKQQYKIPGSKYRADGFLAPNIAFEFHGCHVHAHQFHNPGCPSTTLPQVCTEDELFRRWAYTKEKIDYMRDRGLLVIEMNSCEWEMIRRNDPEVKEYLKQRFYPPSHKTIGNVLSYSQILSCLRSGKIFGLALVDIETPATLRKYFEIMQPLIMNRMVERKDLGPLMEQYCIDNDTMKKPRRVLGQAFSARNILLITPMLRWYMEHGLIVTKLHWVRQFRPSAAFKPLVDKVITYRAAADKDPALSLQGESMKLAGNSIYGKTLESGANYSDVRIADEKALKRAVERKNFCSSDCVADDLFEVETSRSQYSEDKCLAIGVFILQYSKMRMLSFIFDFLDVYLHRDTWQSVLMDTDSLYIALAGEDLDSLVGKHHYNDYLLDKKKFMVCTDRQKRTPGLMKQEWSGDGVISLAPKTYICFNKDLCTASKSSHKGVQASNKLTPQHYFDVLRSQRQHKVVNKGLWFKKGKFVRYSQVKSGLPYLITKLKTQGDGVTLLPLDEPENGVNAILDESDYSDSDQDENLLEIDDCSENDE